MGVCEALRMACSVLLGGPLAGDGVVLEGVGGGLGEGLAGGLLLAVGEVAQVLVVVGGEVVQGGGAGV